MPLTRSQWKNNGWEGLRTSMSIFTNEQIKESARCANFMQKFKMLMCEKMKPGTVFMLEQELDEVAMKLLDYIDI